MIQWTRLHRIAVLSRDKALIGLAFVSGGLVGIAAWSFIRLLDAVQFWPLGSGRAKVFFLSINPFWAVAIPAIGGLLAGLVVQFLDHSVKGTGTAEIIYAVRRKKGYLAGRWTVLKALASIFTVCSGGSAGPEGPVVSIGAGLGSWLGESFAVGTDGVRDLAVAGAAAGFASVFNAPIAGVLFAIEVLLRELDAQSFLLVVLCTFTASTTAHLLLGNEVFVRVPTSFAFNSPSELAFYALLGLLSAIISKLFIQGYFALDHWVEERRGMPIAVKTMLGGLAVGLLGLAIPQALGNSHTDIPMIIRTEMMSPLPWELLLILMVTKMISCPLTLGTGGSGGIYIPFLFIGGALGGLVGRLAHGIIPGAAPSWAYMLVGMGTVFSGITYAPLTGIVLLFELTGQYSVVLPAMFAIVVTIGVARVLDPESIDGHKLLRKGLRLHESPEFRVLEKYSVGDLMAHSVVSVPAHLPLTKLPDFTLAHPHSGYPVVNAEGNLVGLLTRAEMQEVLDHPDRYKQGSIADVMRSRFPTVDPEFPLGDAVRLMILQDADRAVVTDPASPGRVVGILSKRGLIEVYRGLV